MSLCSNVSDRSSIYQVNLNATDRNDVRIKAAEMIQSGMTVLDVGCACGDFGVYLKRNLECTVHGFEYDSGSVAIAMSSGAYQSVHQVDLNALNSDLQVMYAGSFDCVVALDVLEHLLDPSEAIKMLATLIKPTGFLVISLPNISFCDVKLNLIRNTFDYSDTGILDRTHLRFFTHKSIAQMMTRANLFVQDCQPKVSDISSSTKGISWGGVRQISRDPHSFVYQYVMKVEIGKGEPDLSIQNNRVLDLKWERVKPILRQIRYSRWKGRLLPAGSRRCHLIKKLAQSMKGSKYGLKMAI